MSYTNTKWTMNASDTDIFQQFHLYWIELTEPVESMCILNENAHTVQRFYKHLIPSHFAWFMCVWVSEWVFVCTCGWVSIWEEEMKIKHCNSFTHLLKPFIIIQQRTHIERIHVHKILMFNYCFCVLNAATKIFSPSSKMYACVKYI